MKSKTYEEFVDKFKRKKTTDDCYTPEHIYNAIAEYVEETYGVSRQTFVRPFYPGVDYEQFCYPDNCIVVDNPPFSIAKKILTFYEERNIKYFLFGNALTAFNCIRGLKTTAIFVKKDIVYENGTKVKTCFFTNMEKGIKARADSKLDYKLRQAIYGHAKTREKNKYSNNVVTSAEIIKYCGLCQDLVIYSKDVETISKDGDIAVYGSGLRLSGESFQNYKRVKEKYLAEQS